MKKTLITITALLIVGFMAASAFAWGHGNGRRGGCGGQGRAMYNDLTDDQKTQLRELRQQFVDATYDTRVALMNKHQEIRMLMETSNPTKAKLQTLSDELLGLKKEMADQRIDFALKAKKIAPELNLLAFGPKGDRGRGGYDGFNKGKRKGKGCKRANNNPCPYNNDGPPVE